MKSLLLSTILLLFTSFSAGQAVTFHGAVAGARLSTSTSSGGHIILFVTQGNDMSGTVTTVLTFHNETRNPDGTITSVIGSGTIPNAAFTQQGPDKMNINVDTSQVAGFNNTTCIFTPSPNFGFQCSPSAGGPVQITWKSNGLNTSGGSGLIVDVIGPVTIRTEDNSDGSSSDAQGTVVGFEFNLTGDPFEAATSIGRDVIIKVTQD